MHKKSAIACFQGYGNASPGDDGMAVKNAPPLIRKARPEDLAFLRLMLFEAFFWRTDQPRPETADFAQKNPEFTKLMQNWGRAGDTAVVAEVEGQLAGAAWYRFWTDEVHSYGYLNPETPEIGIGVIKKWRGQGIGRALLRDLLAEAQRQGVRVISLSVEAENPALRLYESEGFEKVGQVGGSWTMRLDLHRSRTG
jgi:ribosomal protein S18 acetylase RimI-like enzyme